MKPPRLKKSSSWCDGVVEEADVWCVVADRVSHSKIPPYIVGTVADDVNREMDAERGRAGTTRAAHASANNKTK